MLRSFSYTLLITWVFIFLGCKTIYIHTTVENRNLIVSESIAPLDSQLVYLYLPYKQKLNQEISRVIAISTEEMIKNKPESKLTNFLADLLLEQGRKDAENINISFSYFNYGGIRTFLPKGEITVGKIFELMPFENEMVFLRLSGTQVQEFLNNIASKGGDSLGGVRFKISDNKAIDVKMNGEPLRLNDDYWLVTNDYVAAGGDGMDVLVQRKEFISSNRKIRDVIISHLEEIHKKGEIIKAEKDGRISMM
jgi:2',3'-cyclic-nucleotide 2'-phosphodiesterase (5'-nucleotidase family)